MKCPACQKELSKTMLGATELDVCDHGCGGIWFDKDEIFQFDEQNEFPTAAILDLADKMKHVKVDQSKPRPCPRCDDEVLVKQFMDIQHQVQMDQCWNCSGIWLDLGELNQLRAQFATMADRKQAVNEFLDTQLKECKQELRQDTKQRVAEIRNRNDNVFSALWSAFQDLLYK